MKTELIVALDLDSFQKAKKIVNLLYPEVKIFKVGLQLFTCCGPKIVNWLKII
jgi:orotidine-5'-phosphate decarboxylase